MQNVRDDSNNKDEGNLLMSMTDKPALTPGSLTRGGGMMSQRTLKWTSVRTPATSLGDALQAAVSQYAPVVERGIRVKKVTSRGVMKRRVITISQDKYAIFITHQSLNKSGGRMVFSTVASKLPLPVISRKGVLGFTNEKSLRDRYVRYIDVADIDFVSFGVVGTLKLENARKGDRLSGADSMVDRESDTVVTIGHHGNETLDVLVHGDEERKQLIACLQTMCDVYKEQKQLISNEALLLRYIWYDVDTNQDGEIGEPEFLKILSRINFNVKNASKTFKEFVKNKNEERKVGASRGQGRSGLSYLEVMELLQDLKGRAHYSLAEQIWDEAFGANEKMVTAPDFLAKFIHGVQGQTDATIDYVESVFRAINSMEINYKKEPTKIVINRQLSLERFEILLHHEINSAYDPRCIEKVGSLTKPMSEYWINTSHNTYLTGDQLQSTSSVEMYLKALRRGCKCLELDCYDGGEGQEGHKLAVVFHGHTLTSKILFADIIRAVKSYIDQHPDTYPIILSLENHCSQPFQLQMAKDLKEILGKYLFVRKVTFVEGLLPSPESLRGKVVIKGKRPPEPDDTAVEDAADNEEDPYDMSEKTEPAAANGGSPTKSSDKKHSKIVKELAQITLFHGTKFKSFRSSILEPSSHMHSIGEHKITKILNKEPTNFTQWREYNVGHMTRTYPAGARVDSSNYYPILAWSLGCQLVALNFQTNDSPLILNDGLFRQGAGCGYVEKHATLLRRSKLPTANAEAEGTAGEAEGTAGEAVAVSKSEEGTSFFSLFSSPKVGADVGGNVPTKMPAPAVPFDQRARSVTERMKTYEQQLKHRVLSRRIKVRLLSGSCLPKPMGVKTGESVDPYVIITVHDVKKDESGKWSHASTSHTSSTVQDNGFFPIWNQQKAAEFVVHKPEFAMIHFSVNEKDIGLDDKLADAVIPVSCLRKGYRSIQLHDRNGTRSGAFGYATLLVEIQIYEMA